MGPTEIDNLLYKRMKKPSINDKDDKYYEYYLEQYRMYIHIFNSKIKGKYYPLSQIEKKIPIIFILFYLVILLLDINLIYILEFFK